MYHLSNSVIGVDLSQEMLEIAAARVRANELRNVDLARMDACKLAFPDASFDLVFSSFVASVVDDRRAYFGELNRVVRPGGAVCVLNHVRFEKGPLRWLERLFERVWASAGWRCDLGLAELVEGVGPGEVSVRRLFPMDAWPVVLCRKSA
jgi:phosphatidylethanolamine/phosphatidyl-N-methylethanolamine N-methyltransferase